MKTNIYKTILWVCILAIAMAFLESAIVVYLRKLYYPEGFCFPLKSIEFDIAVTEFLREIATLIMLIAIGIIAGRKNIERFAFFIFSFAIWDIFYYVFLKLLISWPESLMTWDVLFLVPVTWVGPVLGPIINSFSMIILALLIIFFVQINGNARIAWIEWILLIVGSLIIITSYTEEYLRFMMNDFTFLQLITSNNSQAILNKALTFVPQFYNWFIFLIGEAMFLIAFMMVFIRNKKLT